MKTLKNILQWLVYSSANPQKFSLTLKAVAFYLVFIFALANITVPQDEILEILLIATDLLTKLVIAYGAARKLFTALGNFTKNYLRK